MNRDEAKAKAKDCLKDYLKKLGRDTSKLFRCISRDHEDKKPSMSYDERRNKVRCFSGSCGVDWDIFDVIGNEYVLTDDKAKFDKTYEVLGINIDQSSAATYTPSDFGFEDLTNKQQQPLRGDSDVLEQADSEGELSKEELKSFFLKAKSNINDQKCVDYLNKRGISVATALSHGVGYISDWQHPKVLAEGKSPPATPRVIIPTGDNSYTARDIRNEEDIPERQERYKKSKYGKGGVFNFNALAGDEPCFVVEGEFDALSFLEIGLKAVALGGSTSNIRPFLAKIKALPHCCPLILTFDVDEAGKKAAKELEDGLKEVGIKCTQCDLYKDTDYKDPNDFLCKDRERFAASAKELWIKFSDQLNNEAQCEADELDINKQNYFSDYRVSDHIVALRESIKLSKDRPVLSTGFAKLDKALGGGLYGALYGIGAITSLGKTTFVIQIADHLASQGHNVLYFSLEMSRYEIMAKSISRHTYLYCKDLSKETRQILDGRLYEDYNSRECEVIYNSGEEYRKYAHRLFIYEGVGDLGVKEIESAVEKHIKYTGKAPVVIIDYLQILAPYNDKFTDKQNTDKAVLELKRITRNFDIPVIAISSLNRQSYKDVISLQAFKESGAIEYSSDVLIGLQLKGAGIDNFDVDAAKSNPIREIELKVLKNRNGKTGVSIEFESNSRFNLFEEV